MDWSPQSATDAYLDAVKLCGKCKTDMSPSETQKPESNEFLSALAAGMSAKLIVEVTSQVSPSTVALAAAARQTGGKLVCILPEETTLERPQQVIEDAGLKDRVEFRTGDAAEVLPSYENIDFSLIDCKAKNYNNLLEKLDVNLKRSVVVANNLIEGRNSVGGQLRGVDNKTKVRSMKHPIGKGMEITTIGKSNDSGRGVQGRATSMKPEKKGSRVVKRTDKSKWVFELDENSGEENIYRMPKSL